MARMEFVRWGPTFFENAAAKTQNQTRRRESLEPRVSQQPHTHTKLKSGWMKMNPLSAYSTRPLRRSPVFQGTRSFALPKDSAQQKGVSVRNTSSRFDQFFNRPAPLRILIAEDDPLLNSVLSIVLNHYGYAVKPACDGANALDFFLEDMNAFDLVITDHQMPNLDGLGFVRNLRAANYKGKIIVLASPPSIEDQNAYGELLVDRLLFKPAGNERLIQAIKEVTLSRQR